MQKTVESDFYSKEPEDYHLKTSLSTDSLNEHDLSLDEEIERIIIESSRKEKKRQCVYVINTFFCCSSDRS